MCSKLIEVESFVSGAEPLRRAQGSKCQNLNRPRFLHTPDNLSTKEAAREHRIVENSPDPCGSFLTSQKEYNVKRETIIQLSCGTIRSHLIFNRKPMFQINQASCEAVRLSG